MTKKEKILLGIIVSTDIIVPLVILFYKDLFYYKFNILTIVSILIYLLFKIFKIPNEKVGITKKGLMDSIKNMNLLNIVAIIGILLAVFLKANRFIPNETKLFYVFYIFISCPLQEFLYRGIFGYFEQVVPKKYIWIIISSILYSFVHIIYEDILTCILTFIIGTLWFSLYRKNYNLAGVILSHMILGILTISMGIIN